eukprot:gene1700-469_t
MDQEILKKIEKCPPRLNKAIVSFQNGDSRKHGRQYPTFLFYPELETKPFYDEKDFLWSSELKKNYKRIQEEFSKLKVEEFKDIKSSTDGTWKQFSFYSEGKKMEENCKKCPFTFEMIEKVTDLMKDLCIGYVYFSVISPGTHIFTHHGVSNIRLRCQLPIFVQEECWLRVEDQVRYYQEGNVMIFDDSYDHEVKHEGFLTNRVVLLIDFFHPDLSQLEKELIKEYFPK